jgi:cytochrome c oxidase subunit 4
MIDRPRAHPPEPSGVEPHADRTTYLVIAAILTIMTLLEVAAFYVPAFRPVLIPLLLALAAIKFTLVAMFYMHLKFDHRLFSAVFLLPLTIAIALVIALLFLLGQFRL